MSQPRFHIDQEVVFNQAKIVSLVTGRQVVQVPNYGDIVTIKGLGIMNGEPWYTIEGYPQTYTEECFEAIGQLGSGSSPRKELRSHSDSDMSDLISW